MVEVSTEASGEVCLAERQLVLFCTDEAWPIDSKMIPELKPGDGKAHK